MSSLNRVILIGNVGRDTEVKTTNTGQKIANFSLATSERWKNGEERTEWHRIVVFNEKLAEIAERFCTKGKQVCVEGQIRSRKYTNQAGQEVISFEIVIDRFNGSLVLLGTRGEGGGERPEATSPAHGLPVTAPRRGGPVADLEDDIPF